MPEKMNCPACLEDLYRPSACEKTLGGMVTEFLYGFKDDVDHWPAKAAVVEGSPMTVYVHTDLGENLTMKGGKRLFRIQVKKASAELKYELQGESGARSFKTTLECNIPGFRSAILGFLSATANHELVILAKTRSGEWHLLGDEDEGVEYDSATANSGKAGTDANGADVTFSTECAAPTVYLGEISHLMNVSGTPAVIGTVTETVSSNKAILSAIVTDNNSNVAKVGFRYKKEGTKTWKTLDVNSHTSGTAFTAETETLDAGDYLYYAFMVSDGNMVTTETYSFNNPS